MKFVSIVQITSFAHCTIDIGEESGTAPVHRFLSMVESVLEHLVELLKHVSSTSLHHFFQLIETRVVVESIIEQMHFIQLDRTSVVA